MTYKELNALYESMTEEQKEVFDELANRPTFCAKRDAFVGIEASFDWKDIAGMAEYEGYDVDDGSDSYSKALPMDTEIDEALAEEMKDEGLISKVPTKQEKVAYIKSKDCGYVVGDVLRDELNEGIDRALGKNGEYDKAYNKVMKDMIENLNVFKDEQIDEIYKQLKKNH